MIWLATGSVSLAEEKFREFRDSTGRSISAKLLHHKGDGTVAMELTTGKEVTVPILRFCDEDQKYLSDWVKATPPKINYALKFEEEELRENTERRNTGYSVYRKSLNCYKVTVTNYGRDTVSDLTLKYQVFMRNETSGYYSYSSGYGRYFKEGTVELPGDIDYNHERTFTTESFVIDSVRYGSSNAYSGKDDMRGVIVRVYDKAGKMVQEWKSQEAEKYKKTWIEKDKDDDRNGRPVNPFRPAVPPGTAIE